MLSAADLELSSLHLEPTKDASDFWSDGFRKDGCECGCWSGYYCSKGLIQVAKQSIVAHLKLISSSDETLHKELVVSKLGRDVMSRFDGNKNGEFCNSDLRSAFEATFQWLVSDISGEQNVADIVNECLILFSGLLIVNDALVSLRSLTVEWVEKCTLVQNVVSWHLSDDRRNLIPKWIQMLLSKAAGLLFFAVAKHKEVCNHQNFLLAFKWFERMIQRKGSKSSQSGGNVRRLMLRKPDKDILENDKIEENVFTITGILNMAACLVELRQTARANTLLDILRQQLFVKAKRNKNVETSDICYQEAYADYLKGVCLFEDTNPQRLAIRKPTDEAYKTILQKKYTEAMECLKKSVEVLESCAPNSSLLASVYTILGIVHINKEAKFSDDGLRYLEKATMLECELKQPRASTQNLLQVLRYGAETAGPEEGQDEWNRVFQKAEKCLAEFSLKVDSEKPTSVDVESTKTKEPSVDESEAEAKDTVISQINETLELAHMYLDCYRKQCLEYFKDRLKRCRETNSFIAEMLCHLFIARYYLYACTKAKVECHQAKVSRIVLTHFGIKLSVDDYKSITLKRLMAVDGEMAPSLALVCGFWIANEAELCLLNVGARNLKLFSPTIHTNDYQSSKLRSVVAGLKIFLASNHFRSLDSTFRMCRSLNEHATLICNELIHSENSDVRQSEFVAFLRIYVGELSYRMCDKIKDNQDFAPSIRKKSYEELSNVLHQNMSTSEGSIKASSLAVMCLTTLGNFCDPPKHDPVSYGMKQFRLHRFQMAYDLCAAAGLTDTEVHASLHMSVGMFLYSNACSNLDQPAFESFNAAIFKFRKAAQIFDTICGNHVGTAMAEGMISVLYFNQMQLEDQEDRALESFSDCLRLEVSLLRNDFLSSPWLWKTIEVVRKCRSMFLGSRSNQFERWDELTKNLEKIRNGDLQTLLAKDDWKVFLRPKVPIFWKISDPLFDADETYLAETSRHLRDMVYPRNSLPTETEVRCYARYLQLMWNHHQKECTPKNVNEGSYVIHLLKKLLVPIMAMVFGQQPDSSYSCPLFKFWIHPRTPDFLAGLNDYTLQRAEKREATFLTLQENHRRMHCCAKIEEFLSKRK